MALLSQHATRPRLACEITPDGVIAARVSEKMRRVEVFTNRRLAPGTLAPGLNSPNVLDGKGLRTAISGALAAVSGKSRDVIVIVPDVAIRVLLLDFEALPSKIDEADPIIRFRLKKSLPFDVEQAILSYEVARSNGAVRVVAAISPRSVVEEYEAAFRDVGYSPGAVLPSSLAALGLVDGQRPTLMLKVDATNITITAVGHQGLRLIPTLDNSHAARFSAVELAEAGLPPVLFFEDTF